MNLEKVFIVTLVSVLLSLMVLGVLGVIFGPYPIATLTELWTVFAHVFMGLIVFAISSMMDAEKMEALLSVPLTTLSTIIVTGLLCGTFNVVDAILTFVLLLPVALVAFFSSWVFFKR